MSDARLTVVCFLLIILAEQQLYPHFCDIIFVIINLRFLNLQFAGRLIDYQAFKVTMFSLNSNLML